MTIEATGERLHHPYSPSTLQAREACPCYDPERTDDVGRLRKAIRGTLQHTAMETGVVGDHLSDEEAYAVAVCKDIVDKEVAAAGPDPVILQEQYLPIDGKPISGTGSDGFARSFEGTTAGYMDLAILNKDLTEATLIDYKFGMWAVEPAKTNRQGQSYLLGLYRLFPKTLRKVKVKFVMPHRDEVSEHTFRREEFARLYLDIRTIVSRCVFARSTGDGGKPDWKHARPNESGCLFCAYKGECSKLAEFAFKVGHKHAPLEVPEVVTPELLKDAKQAGIAVKVSNLLEAWAKSVRARCTERAFLAEDGWVPEGYSLTPMVRRVVKDKPRFLDLLRKAFPQSVLDEATSITFEPIDDAVKARAATGTKAATLDKWNNDLTEAGILAEGKPYGVLRLQSKPKA